jgi:hypothetical protein
MAAMNHHSSESLFPAELHAKAALDCELTAAELAREIAITTCPIRRTRLENKHAQKIRNSAFHRALAERTGVPNLKLVESQA